MRLTRLPSALTALTFLCAFDLLLTGCTLQNTAISAPDGVRGSALAGVVYGGQQPISGAKLYLLAVNPTGYGGPGIAPSAANASVSLLNPATTQNAPDNIGSYVLSNSNGSFNVAGDYSCTSGSAQSTASTVALSGSEQVYLYALGGNTGTAVNPAAGLLVALGPCNNPTLKVTLNEATTIAAAYAFAGFASDATHIGSSGSPLALTNLNIAFGNVASLIDTSTGIANPGSTAITTPLQNLYTLADILAACVDSSTASMACPAVFQYAQSSGTTGTSPTDTATAAINLAHNPWPTQAGMDALYGLVPASGAPFPNSLPYEPNDFTLVLAYTGGGLNNPSSIAIDAAGNAWITNYNITNDNLSEFSSNGTPLSPSTGFVGGGITTPDGVAVDTLGNVWLTDITTNALSEFSNLGQPRSAQTGDTGGGLAAPQAIAIDGTNHLWILNPGIIGSYGSVSEFSDGGTPILATPYSSGEPNAPYGNAQAIALDSLGNIWLANFGDSLTEYAPSGAPLSPATTGFIGGGLNGPAAIAIDPSGNVWAANSNSSTVSKFSSAGTALSPSTGWGNETDAQPVAIAIDGAGSVWIANAQNANISEFSSTGVAISPVTGYTNNQLSYPSALAIDGAGNIWVPAGSAGNSLVSEFIGAAAPVVTPVAANLASPYKHPASLP
jgi:sugar lactone lactonase YvrE